MPDTKITALAAITTVDPAADVLPIVDISDTSMAASGTTKKITSNQILGAGGTATLASATITGDLTVDTSTLKVDSANNRVGVLTATPRAGFALDVLGNVALGNSTTTTSNRLKLDCSGTAGNVAIMSFAAAGTNKAFYGLSGGFLGDTSTDAIVATDAAGAAIRFFVSNTATEVARFNSTGNLAFANGKGIDFSATAEGGTMTSELLNDYEEGTWTGTLKGSTSDPTTPVTATGKYTKIGRQVMVQIYFNGNTTGASSRIFISGLPFAASSAPPDGTTGSILMDAMGTFTGSPTCWTGASGTTMELYQSISNGATASVVHNPGANRSLWASLTYTV